MRSRGIKPGFFKNENLADLSHQARLLYIGLWCMADREGRLEDRPRRIKAELFPFEKCDCEGLLTILASRGFIRRYGPAAQPCLDIPTFKLHQNPHKNETPSVLPAYGDIATLREHSGAKTEPLGLTPSSLTPDSRLLTPEKPQRRARGVDNELLDELLDMAASVRSKKAAWRPNASDRQTFAALCERFPPEQLRRELLKLKAYAPQREYKDFGRTFASWMGRVTPDPETVPRPTARSLRIAKAIAELEAGGSEEAAHAMCNSDEWAEVVGRAV